MNVDLFTGIVVCFNESRYLHQCLECLSFCAERLVVDLGSSDDSVAIAKELGARVIFHERVDLVEEVRAFAIEQASTDWVIFMDPDMLFPIQLISEVTNIVQQESDVGWIELPYVNYFRGKRLTYSRWSPVKIYPAILHKNRVEFMPEVHRGIRIRTGFTPYRMSVEELEDHIIHYWVDSYWELFKKHFRYLRYEGAALYKNGHRFSWQAMIKDISKQISEGVLRYHGITGGPQAWFLTAFWIWYVIYRWLALRRYVPNGD